MAEMEKQEQTVWFNSNLNKGWFGTVIGCLFVFLAILFNRMIKVRPNGSAEAEVYLGIGIAFLMFGAFMLWVKRFSLSDKEIIVMSYWKKPKAKYEWDEFVNYRTYTPQGVLGKLQRMIVLQKKDGKALVIQQIWVSNLDEIEKFVAGKLTMVENPSAN